MRVLAKKISSITNIIAGICFFAVMVIVVVNIVMRKMFSSTVYGAYELVGLLTATGIGLAQAQCSQDNGHIAVSILTDRLSPSWQKIIDCLLGLSALGLWLLLCQRMFVFALTTLNRGRVSSTAQLPMYPFMFIIAFGLLCLCLVHVSTLIHSFTGSDEKETT